MSGGLWIASYVVLFAGVMLALATSLAVARQVGRLLVVGAEEHGDADRALAPGSPAPPLELVALGGAIIRPHQWESGLLLQIAVSSEHDVEQILEFDRGIPSDFSGEVLLSAIGSEEHLNALTIGSSRVHLFADSNHQVAAAIRTSLRPHALFIRHGIVEVSTTFESVEELESLLTSETEDDGKGLDEALLGRQGG